MPKIKKYTLKQIFENEHILPATYNVDLIEYLKKYDGKNGYHFAGVIMKNEINRIEIHDKMFMIVNYDNSNQQGSHWVAVVKNGNDVMHFGSYGIPPLRQIKGKFSKYQIYYNDRPVQMTDSSICGYLCLNFIEFMIEEKKTFYEFISKCLEYSNRYMKDVS